MKRRRRAQGGRVVAWVIALLLARSAAAQHTGGSFGGSRGFGGGSSHSSSSSSSSSSSGSSRSGSSWGGSSSSSSDDYAARQRREDERRRREEAREAEERAAQERRRRAEEAERARQEQLRLERERLAAELALPPSQRALSDRFVGGFAYPPLADHAHTVRPDPAGRRVAWWGGEATPPVGPRTRKRVGAGMYAFGLAALLTLAYVLRRAWRRWQRPDAYVRGRAAFPGSAPSGVGPRATLRVLTVAIDWTRRAAVQQALAAQSGRHDLSTAQGMFASWVAVRAILQESRRAIRYVGWQHELVPVSEAGRRFEALADDLRGRYVVETVREAARTAGPTAGPRREEGGGLVVVSVVVGMDGVRKALPTAQSAATLGQVLGNLGGGDAEALVALRTVWSPTDEGDRLSSAELEALYPSLHRLDDGVGRVTCAHCRAVWARELGCCPSCGATAAPPV
ncbi:MAG: DUF1517 domain-containing protein [Deltaproteobacteria bacterium]|nr:DUF1517 domain-containing protein [Deltaproteobacteria bacterium]